MRKIIFSVTALLLMISAALGTGCYGYHRGVGVEVDVHDARWHYDHDHNDEWRRNHPWNNDRNDYDR